MSEGMELTSSFGGRDEALLQVEQEEEEEERHVPPYSGLGCCCSCIPAGSVGVVQQFGDYVGYQNPGCMMYCLGIQEIQEVSLAVRQIDCRTECKTKDNVTLSATCAVQYRINKNKLKQAVFDIVDPEAQIRASVDNVVRSSVPTMDLDETYSNKDKLCMSVLASVRNSMKPFGYIIKNVLVTDLAPDRAVLQAMNAINASRRQREAAIEQGEAQKVLQVKNAEADAESKHLSGVGMARMRVAMAQGFKDSMASMAEGGLNAREAMHMMVTTQYLDMLKDFASNPSQSSILVSHSPGSVRDIEAQVREGFLSVGGSTQPKPRQQEM